MRILYAEGKDETRERFGKKLLERGHAVVLVEDGKKLLETLAHDRAFDLVIADHLLSIITGLDALESIRKNPHLTKLKVLIFSTDEKNKKKAKALGGAFANKYTLLKGDKICTLVERIVLRKK